LVKISRGLAASWPREIKMNKSRKRELGSKKERQVSPSVLTSELFFWFDLGLIVISGCILIANFFKIGAPSFDVYLLIIFSIIGLGPVILSALKALIKRQLTIDLLASIALIFSLLAHEWSSAVFISLMLASARLFARYTATRARNAISSLMKLRPTKAHLLVNGKVNEIDAADIRIGDLILIESGERSAIDGVVESGTASMDQSSLTGESLLIEKKTGDQIFSSTLNESGSIVVRAKKVGGETIFSKMVELVEKSQLNKAPIASTLNRFAQWYIIVTLVGAGLLYFFTKNLALVLSVLLVTCADDLSVALPLAFTAAIGAFAKKGIIVKGGEFLEGLTKLKTIIFDKTGTITEGKSKVEEVITFGGFQEENLLGIVGALEGESGHPNAKAIQKYVEGKNIKLPQVTKVHEEPGFGIKGMIDGKEILAGKTKFLKDNEVVFSDEESALIEEQKTKGRTITVLSVDKKAIGFVALMDAVRPSAAQVMRQLKNLGVEHLMMLTGDNEKIAADVAGRVGINEFKANLLPQDKIDFLKQALDPKYKLAMVGDGVNDAASLALADVGIAMGAIGMDAAIEAADVVLMKDDLENIPEAIKTSQYVLKIIRQDILIWTVTNSVGLVLALIGVLGPAGAAAYNFLTDFLPLLNSLRIFQFHLKTKTLIFRKRPAFWYSRVADNN